MQESFFVKKDENFPLLMVAGAGDAAVLAPHNPTAPLWSNTNIIRTRRSWSERWPEYLSSCWMTFVLLSVSFLIFYAIGILVIYRAESYVLVRCNDTKPASSVFYHSVIPRGGIIPLASYSSYLSYMALRFPSLHFHVMFLQDDSMSSKHIKFYSKLYPHAITFNEDYHHYNNINRREIRDFRKRYNNVNITVVPLSTFMASTPMKYKWKAIPMPHLPFYARVWSVWSKGGVGLDLTVQNELYQNGQLLKTDAILRQHNDGINAERYIATLNKIQRDEESAILSSFLNMFQKMLNETLSMFNNTLPYAYAGENSEPKEEILHRSKRSILEEKKDIKEDSDTKAPPQAVVNIVLANASVVNVTGDTNKDNIYQLSSNNDTKSAEVSSTITTTNTPAIWNHIFNTEGAVPNETFSTEFEVKETEQMTEVDFGDKKNKSEHAQVVFFYDFSIVSEPIHPAIEPQRLIVSKRGIKSRSLSNPPKFVTVETEGTFIAATSPMHPFLSGILSAGCKSLFHPRLAIQNALMSQCSGLVRDESYCNSIYVF